MDWSQKRKIMYATLFAAFLVLLAAYPVYKLVSKPATCFDGRKNGTETGVDCGGSCALMCAADVKPLRALWAKAFPTDGRTYDLGAYIENPNANAGIRSVRYTISVRDSGGSVLAEKRGSTELAPASRTLIFETGVSFSGVPASVSISFDSTDLSKWEKATDAPSPVVTKNQSLKNTDTTPRFDAVLVNTDPVNDVSKLSLGAIIYDVNKIPVAISKTYVDSIPKAGEQDIFFTWPTKFTKHAHGETCIGPTDTMFVVDHSSTMDVGHSVPPEPLESIKNGARSYVDFVPQADKVGLISFADTASSTVDAELSSDHTAVDSAIAALTIKKTTAPLTNLGDALIAATAALKGPQRTDGAHQVIVAITDGFTARPVDKLSPKSRQYAEDYAANAAADARNNNISVYAISAGKSINEGFLKNRIAGSAAQYFSTSTSQVLQTIYKNVAEITCPVENFITEIVITPRAIFTD